MGRGGNNGHLYYYDLLEARKVDVDFGDPGGGGETGTGPVYTDPPSLIFGTCNRPCICLPFYIMFRVSSG